MWMGTHETAVLLDELVGPQPRKVGAPRAAAAGDLGALLQFLEGHPLGVGADEEVVHASAAVLLAAEALCPVGAQLGRVGRRGRADEGNTELGDLMVVAGDGDQSGGTEP